MGPRGQIPSASGGHSTQAPGMIRHGPFPGLGSAAGHRSLESLPSPELLENKIAFQVAEIERLTRENQRLAATPLSLRQDLVAAHHEMQRLQAHIGSIRTESDIQIRLLLEKIAKMEVDIRAGESIKKDVEQAHQEAQSSVSSRQELATQIQQITQDLQKSHAEIEHLPELHTELNKLRQEHHMLRAAFEHEKGMNIEQVEQMQVMEKDLVSMAREVEKLRAEVLNAEKRVRAPNLYGGTYGNPDSSYPPPVQGGGSFVDGYGRPHVHIGSGMTGNGGNIYGSTGGGGGGGGGGGDAATAGAVSNSGSSVGWAGSYDAIRGTHQGQR